MIQVPARELACGNPARDRVKPPEQALGAIATPLENGVMHHFVEQHSEIEHCKPLHERQRHPHQGVRDDDEGPRRQTKNRELPRSDQEMAAGGFRVERTQAFSRQRVSQLGAQRRRMPAVMVGFHVSNTQRL